MKKEYPKMIYKKKEGDLEGGYKVVKDKAEHDEVLKEWSGLVEKNVKVSKTKSVSADSDKAEVKPRRRGRPPKKKV
jgi:hypothetical protein